jgi:LemA protein
MKKILIGLGVVIVLCALFLGSTYNGLVKKQEQVAQSFGQVQAVYQRRLDLIPNLVATVKGYASHEKNTLIAVTKARQVASAALHPAVINNPKQFKQFSASQANLGNALNRLMVVVERYPNLKASENFLTLQTQLEGTENRIAIARERFNDATQSYNTAIRQFPANVVSKFGSFTAKPYFQASVKAATAPTVKF